MSHKDIPVFVTTFFFGSGLRIKCLKMDFSVQDDISLSVMVLIAPVERGSQWTCFFDFLLSSFDRLVVPPVFTSLLSSCFPSFFSLSCFLSTSISLPSSLPVFFLSSFFHSHSHSLFPHFLPSLMSYLCSCFPFLPLFLPDCLSVFLSSSTYFLHLYLPVLLPVFFFFASS